MIASSSWTGCGRTSPTGRTGALRSAASMVSYGQTPVLGDTLVDGVDRRLSALQRLEEPALVHQQKAGHADDGVVLLGGAQDLLHRVRQPQGRGRRDPAGVDEAMKAHASPPMQRPPVSRPQLNAALTRCRPSNPRRRGAVQPSRETGRRGRARGGRASLRLLERRHVDHEAVLHVALQHPLVGLVDLLDRDHLDVGRRCRARRRSRASPASRRCRRSASRRGCGGRRSGRRRRATGAARSGTPTSVMRAVALRAGRGRR